MRSLINFLLIGLSATTLIFVFACGNSTGPDNPHAFPAPIDSAATDITLYVYLDIHEVLGAAKESAVISPIPDKIILDTLEMDAEGSITVDIEVEEPYTNSATMLFMPERTVFTPNCTSARRVRL